jgi:hypothetical protein
MTSPCTPSCFPLLCTQPFVVVGFEHFAIFHGRERKSCRRAQKSDVVVAGFLLEDVEGGFLLLLEAVRKLLTTCLILVAFEGFGDNAAKFLDQLRHVGAQLNGLAGRQLQCAWLVRVLEIVDVTVVVRYRLGGGLRFDELFDDRVFAAGGGPKRVEVETLLANAHAKADGIERARLTDDLLAVCDVMGAREVEDAWVARREEIVGVQSSLCH